MDKILIANRGEIAVRIIRSAREMGIATVAVYSDADATALHVQMADEAYRLGPPPSRESYLLMDDIIQLAQKTGAQGIHPGYGFLSENAAFARKVNEVGLTFIGPDPHAIEVMGNKLAAKQTVKAYDIPMLPGTDEPVTSVEAGRRLAEDIGFPVLIKAAAGGGGKGMRIVDAAEDFEASMQRAISEAQSAFGDGSVFIEKYIASPRHIEIQVLADRHGHVVHLFERECSVQRRHQKVVEEAPSGVLSPDLRQRMGASAVDVARSCDYVGAGTVEFLLDEHHHYYFLEMNTRLQVEHPVTELISGKDLVKEQIRIARGEALSFSQEDLSILGHAIELRVYAEDPKSNFLPSVGRLQSYRLPDGPGIRVDGGYQEGDDIPIHYDPMIAKLVAYGHDRMEAIERMHRACNEFQLQGVAHTLSFGAFVMQHPSFQKADYDTHFVQRHFDPAALDEGDASEADAAALLGAWLAQQERQAARRGDLQDNMSTQWKEKRKRMRS